jgi:uncharacterized membrane protein
MRPVPAEFHPITVHFAVALLVVGPALDLFGLLFKRESLLSAGRWNTLVGAGALLVTLLSGLSAESGLGPHSSAGGALLPLHRALGFVTAAVWVPGALWRALDRHLLPQRLRTLYLTVSYAGAALILGQAALGSTMVYLHGVGLSAAARAEPPPPKPTRLESR